MLRRFTEWVKGRFHSAPDTPTWYTFGRSGNDHITWADEWIIGARSQRVIGWCERQPRVGDRLVTPTIGGALVEWVFVDVVKNPRGGMFVGDIQKQRKASRSGA